MSSQSNNKHTVTDAGLPRARARFLAQAIQLEEEGISETVKYSVYTVMGLLVLVLIWMSLTQVSEVTVTSGKVVPVGYIHNIQHLEGGIIGNIHVQDGDRVEAGDLLVSFAPPATEADFDQLVIRKAFLALDLARIAALRNGVDLQLSEELMDYPQLAAKEADATRTQRASYDSELEVIDARIEQRGSELQRQRNKVVVLEEEVSLLQEQVDIRSELAEKNAISKTDLLSVKSQHAALLTDLREAEDSVRVARTALEEEQKRRSEALARQRKELEDEAASAEAQLAEVTSSLIKAKDRVDRLQVYAPVNGIVQGLTVTTINAVVAAGDVIMQIVPVDDEMIVESRLMPDEVGYITLGQVADVKVDSYDATRFGSIKGTVQQISPSTYLDEEANPYYKVKVSLEKSFMGSREGEMDIIPGMTVQAHIITGSKSIMEYLMKPVTRGFSNAFQQR
ncbi:MAG: HlyD family type I secretion periplasmic adaptor subunit [Halioglobus sp.]|nr:HlyD family type I secretion periplasmic adaptor subunit [Halioglobus sp.]